MDYCAQSSRLFGRLVSPLFRCAVAATLLATAVAARGDDASKAVEPEATGHEGHAAHARTNDYARRIAAYRAPDVVLRSQSGEEVRLRQLLDSGEPVALNFIYTSCTTVCPLMTATFAQFGRDLPSAVRKPLRVSVSVDPEYDTPERLKEYAARFGADPHWYFLTGELSDIVAVQTAFDAYTGGKLTHEPVVFLRKGRDAEWVRMDGFPASSDLVREYEGLTTD